MASRMTANSSQPDSGAGRISNGELPNLKIADNLQMQFIDNPNHGRFAVKLIGYLEGQSLIVTAPLSANGNLLLLKEGQSFVVRSLSGRQVLAFQAEVMKTCMVPYPYVHLRLQRPPEKLDLRNAHRVDVDLIASVKGISEQDGMQQETASVAATILDISTSGCLVRTSEPFEEAVTRLSLSLRFDVAEHNRTLQLEADICSHREIEKGDADKVSVFHLYGVRFGELEDDKRLVLNCFVYERITHEHYEE